MVSRNLNPSNLNFRRRKKGLSTTSVVAAEMVWHQEAFYQMPAPSMLKFIEFWPLPAAHIGSTEME